MPDNPEHHPQAYRKSTVAAANEQKPTTTLHTKQSATSQESPLLGTILSRDFAVCISVRESR